MTETGSRYQGLIDLGLTAAVILSVSYFSYAALLGDYGVFRHIRAEAQAEKLGRELAALRAERAVMENRTRRLSSEALDLDLLDEQARKVLGMIRGDEIIVR